jgi:uncharacterized membrane protein
MTESPLIILLGRLHPAVVHFPIGLLTLAAILEGWQFLRGKRELHAATPACLVIGTVAALAASVLGWLLEETTGGGGDVVELHKWVGLSATGVAILALLIWCKTQESSSKMVLRALLFGVATLVGATGYLGGELVFGANHLFKGLFDSGSASTQLAAVDQPKPKVSGDPRARVDFVHEVAPVLQVYCLRCHGGEKVKGKVDLRSYAALAKSGRGESKALVPGNAEGSTLYTSLIADDPDEHMPPKKEKQITSEQVEIIRKWIAEGADWPAGFELK